ncbi:TetR/AcrR family transcriptional regulator [uncultured Devosia sp.]|uniref:TetR/AcrR family transcriptional regulator n=1 Tax=uncultured Devosia sp. TaxID=211434 RepID=UPI0035CB7C19
MGIADKGGSRSALVTAAVATIVAEGWQGAGVRSITARAGVPLGALNYHFGSRDALLRHAAMAEIGRMFQTPAALIAHAPVLVDLVAGMLTWATSPSTSATQQILLLEVMAQARRDLALAGDLQAALVAYRDTLAHSLLRLVPPRLDQGSMAHEADCFAAHCNGLWLQSVIEPAFPADQATEVAVDLWTRRFSGR